MLDMDATGTRFEPPRWFWNALIWSGIGLFDATQTVVVMRSEGMHHAWVRLFATVLLSWLPWALATPLVLRLAREVPSGAMEAAFDVGGAPWGVRGHRPGMLAWTAAFEVALNPYAKVPGPDTFTFALPNKFYNSLLAFLILYAGILAVRYMLDSRERLALQQTEAARLNEQLSKAQLDALRRQIEPHFLFNALNAIAGLVREKRTMRR